MTQLSTKLIKKKLEIILDDMSSHATFVFSKNIRVSPKPHLSSIELSSLDSSDIQNDHQFLFDLEYSLAPPQL